MCRLKLPQTGNMYALISSSMIYSQTWKPGCLVLQVVITWLTRKSSYRVLDRIQTQARYLHCFFYRSDWPHASSCCPVSKKCNTTLQSTISILSPALSILSTVVVLWPCTNAECLNYLCLCKSEWMSWVQEYKQAPLRAYRHTASSKIPTLSNKLRQLRV